jgi:hypothetical protein
MKEKILNIMDKCLKCSTIQFGSIRDTAINGKIEAAEEISKLFSWIPVSERLPVIPEGKKEVVCFVGNAKTKGAQVGYFRGYYCNVPLFQDECDFSISATHWIPISELPEEAQQ